MIKRYPRINLKREREKRIKCLIGNKSNYFLKPYIGEELANIETKKFLWFEHNEPIRVKFLRTTFVCSLCLEEISIFDVSDNKLNIEEKQGICYKCNKIFNDVKSNFFYNRYLCIFKDMQDKKDFYYNAPYKTFKILLKLAKPIQYDTRIDPIFIE